MAVTSTETLWMFIYEPREEPVISESTQGGAQAPRGLKPTPQEVRQHLARVLASAEFQRTDRSRALLQFLVECTLDGESESIKESLIGVQVFGRPADYDPKIDPAVRVSMGRLRTKLDRYYAQSGAEDAIRIAIPKGAYVPTFERVATVPETPTAKRRWKAIVGGAALSGVAVLVVLGIGRPAQPPVLDHLRPFSTTGSPNGLAFSPSGETLAFDAEGPGDQHRNIYLQRLDTASPTRLTKDAGGEVAPTWSPDGGQIAFLRDFGSEGWGVFVMPARGGEARKLAELGKGSSAWLNWSPDGKWIAAAEPVAPTGPGVVLISAASGEKRVLTSTPKGWRGDSLPVFSEDSSKVAFRRTGLLSGSEDLYVVAARGGAPKRITFDERGIGGEAFLKDGSILFSSRRSGSIPGIWWLPADGSVLRRLTSATVEAGPPTVSRDGKHVAFAKHNYDVNIWRYGLDGTTAAEAFLASELTDSSPQYSADGGRIVFQSARSGTDSLWVANGDGTGARLLVDGKGAAIGNPHWSPDAKEVVFEWHTAGKAQIYVVASDGGKPRALAPDGYEDSVPVFSHDGRWVYFNSTKTGRPEIWRVGEDGGIAVQVTNQEAVAAMPSADGRYLFYVAYGAKRQEREIWRMELASGNGERLVEGLAREDWPNWAVGKSGVYYLRRREGLGAAIEYLDLGTRKTRVVYVMQKAPAFAGGLAVSGDERWLLFTQVDRDGSSIFVQ